MEGSSDGAGPSGTQPAVEPRSGSNKRKRLQQGLDDQVIDEADEAARLEESQQEEDFEKPEAKILAYRKKSLELREKVDEARKKLKLEKLNQGVDRTLERFDDARESLTNAAAAKVRKVEDDYAKKQLERAKERQAIEKEEKRHRDNLNRSRQEYALFHDADAYTLDNLVTMVQTPEVEQEEDLEEEEMDDDEDDQDHEADQEGEEED
mgnify:CR=1 FL=1